ncbi:V-type proton ATPase subunit G1-like isoform X1 [Malus sylvestris]|nr:V-type proton ATPase subunit G1-like isoform X1 [Malus sylvestris]
MWELGLLRSSPFIHIASVSPLSSESFTSSSQTDALSLSLSLPTFSLRKMASNRGQGGIQQLLAAEQEAQHIVNAARSAKMARLKQAKDEAEREIAEYRAHVESEFQKKVQASSGDSGANVKRLEYETAEKINHLSTEGSRISSEVVQMLLKQVTTVRN